MLLDVQHSEAAGLHIKEAPENFAKIIGILVPAGDRDFVHIHRGEKEEVLRVFHSGPMNPFGGIAAESLAIDPAEVIRISMEFSRDQ